MEIKNRWSDEVIYKSEKTTLREALIEGLKAGANLSEANLSEANLSEANLYEANLGKDFPFYKFQICAQGSIIGWKKLSCGNVLCLEIPADADRLNAPSSRKCRASYAIPRSLHDSEGKLLNHAGKTLTSQHNSEFTYEIGKACMPDKFDEDKRVECSSGIHFFITFEEARDY